MSLSCSDKNEQEILSDKKLELTSIQEIELPADHMSGIVFQVVQLNDKSLLINDFARRQVLKFDLETNMIEDFTTIGRGPSEFLRPMFMHEASDKKELFISDASTTDIKVLTREGDFIKSIQHKLGGKKFALADSLIYLHGVLDSLVKVIDYEGNTLKSFIKPPQAYEIRSRRFAGGGIVRLGEQIFVMNSLEPVIYRVDVDTLKTSNYSKFTPVNWTQFVNNFDQEKILRSSSSELVRNRKDFAIFLDLFKLEIQDNFFLAVQYSWLENMYLNILTPEGELMYMTGIEYQIVGSHENRLFGFNNSSEDNSLKILEVNYSN